MIEKTTPTTVTMAAAMVVGSGRPRRSPLITQRQGEFTV